MLPLERRPTTAFTLVLAAMAHAVGWPVCRGGSGRISEALAALLRSLGGEVRTGSRVDSVDDLPPCRAVLLDVSPRAAARIGRDHLPEAYRRRLERYRYGPGVFKIDWALDGPVPWRARLCGDAGTVHLGGSLEEIARAALRSALR